MVQYREPTLKNSSPRDLHLNDPPGKKTGQGDWAEAKNLEFVDSARLFFFFEWAKEWFFQAMLGVGLVD